MSTKDSHLYGAPRPIKRITTLPPNPTTTAFSSALSSLLTAPSTTAKPPKPTPTASSRPTNRNDIFTAHNRNAKKRAAADMLSTSSDQQHSTTSEKLDDAAWRRTRRKMDDKARLYAALKRGDVEDKGEKFGVDFDRKWAARDGGAEVSEQSDDDEDDEEDVSRREVVEFQDGFGRTRKGTRAEMLREAQKASRQAQAQVDLVEEQARPSMPGSVIYGDTIQIGAFRPEEDVAAQMAQLAANRDREPTPPKDEHYDATKEIRTKGTGFYQFSGEKEERERQFEELEKLRKATEQARGERVDEKEAARLKREKDVEERRKLIRQKKEKMQARRFLDDMGNEMISKRDAA